MIKLKLLIASSFLRPAKTSNLRYSFSFCLNVLVALLYQSNVSVLVLLNILRKDAIASFGLDALIP